VSCVFCRIVAGLEPSSAVYEDELVLAFLDLYPVNPGHTLVVPKAHAAALGELPEETGAHMFRVAQRVAARMRCGPLRPEGVNLWLADGKAAYQEVFHMHLHVFPRYEGDGFHMDTPMVRAERADLDRVADLLRAAPGVTAAG
jgi:histidine triad (HIT) family protein